MGKQQPSDPPLGPLLRLEGIDYDRLPPHECSKDTILPLIKALLKESLDLIGTVDVYDEKRATKPNPSGWYPKGSVKYSGVKSIGGPGEVVVELLERDILQSELKAVIDQPLKNGTVFRKSTNPVSETWACRRSFHKNEAVGGTADWDEFFQYMKDQHVETEKEMTHTVVGANTIQSWPAAPLIHSIDLEEVDEEEEKLKRGPKVWTKFTLQIVEMKHDLESSILDDRVFPVLQMTCRSVQNGPEDEFLVTSVPINDWEAVPGPRDGKKLADARKIEIGSYASVERFRLVRKEDNRAPPLKKDLQIEWTMATASHARGWLPLFIQKPYIPKKIAIDVPLFLKFMVTKREEKAQLDDAIRSQQQPDGVQTASEQPVAGQSAANQPVGNPQAEA